MRACLRVRACVTGCGWMCIPLSGSFLFALNMSWRAVALLCCRMLYLFVYDQFMAVCNHQSSLLFIDTSSSTTLWVYATIFMLVTIASETFNYTVSRYTSRQVTRGSWCHARTSPATWLLRSQLIVLPPSPSNSPLQGLLAGRHPSPGASGVDYQQQSGTRGACD